MKNNKDILISKYTSLFHDGHITYITHKNNNIEMWMESAEVLPEWNEDNIPLSKRNTICGTLYLQDVETIYEYDQIYNKEFKFFPPVEKANISSFDVESHIVHLKIWWVRYYPEYEQGDLYVYKIKAGKIIWKNDPTLIDSWWECDDEE